MIRSALAVTALIGSLFLLQTTGAAQQAGAPVFQISATTIESLRSWDTFVTQRSRSGQLRLLSADVDPMLPTHTVERYQQLHNGVPIWGGEIVRDSEQGVPISIFGSLSPDLDLSVVPDLSRQDAVVTFQALGGDGATLLVDPQLVILPMDTGQHRLSYMSVVGSTDGVWRVFIDVASGEQLLRYSELHTQSAVGTGQGLLGDTKKISASLFAGAYRTSDALRPPSLRTFDLRNDLSRAKQIVINGSPLFDTDIAADSDNVWVDVAVVDAHVHIGWTYDYYFRRFGRRGLDNNDRQLVVLTNGVSKNGALTISPDDADFAIGAFWCGLCGPGGVGVMYFGNGIPENFFLRGTGQTVTNLAGALDIAAHEFTHGVTNSTSRLIYRNESGALNEAFSDIMGTSVEFFYQPAGNGRGRADYLMGEDVFRAVTSGARDGIRSMANPRLFEHPDHYSRRFLGSADDGGVHINSGIANHAFYLAVEGGRNRTSNVPVVGVGAANREQIERVYYRAFTLLMPANSTFSTARTATSQAAHDLYPGLDSVERAVTQAWSAVGVFEQASLNFTFSPSPVTGTTDCGTRTPPCWPFRVTVRESSGIGFNVTASSSGFFDTNRNLLSSFPLSFRGVFNNCGPASSRMPAGGTACSDGTASLGGRASGFVAFAIQGTDDNGNSLSFVSDLLRLLPVAGGGLTPERFRQPSIEWDRY